MDDRDAKILASMASTLQSWETEEPAEDWQDYHRAIKYFKEQADHINALQAEVARYRNGLTQIAGSHWERWGMCQTDIDEIPDLSGDEAMSLARHLLGDTDDARQALKGTDNAE